MSEYLNCTNQQPPSYSGVTINITNPAVNIPPQCPPVYYQNGNNAPAHGQAGNQGQYAYYNQIYPGAVTNPIYNQEPGKNIYETQNEKTVREINQAYPPQYYMNNYDVSGNNPNSSPQNPGNQTQGLTQSTNTNPSQNQTPNNGPITIVPVNYSQPEAERNGYPYDNQTVNPINENNPEAVNLNDNQNIDSPDNNPNAVPDNQSNLNSEEDINTDTSKGIIEELDVLQAQQKELEKNSKKTKIVSLTNEYIMSLENYLNNPNSDIRLMAAKEILTRLDEDKDRYDDAALNALINKMLQDPNKLVRIAAMSALSSELASGNDYTVQLLTQIQQNPEADPEDVLEASQILLKRTATTEVVYTPVYNNQQQKADE